jgi:anti-anti-sigma factor
VSIERHCEAGVVVLVVRGRLGSRGTEALAEALAGEVSSGGNLVLDLTGVDYVSSPALRALRSEADRRRAAGSRVLVCGVGEAVRAGLELAGLTAGLAVVATRERAVAEAAG